MSNDTHILKSSEFSFATSYFPIHKPNSIHFWSGILLFIAKI